MASRPAIDYARDLNPDQFAAVTHGDGPQLVLAGAGSGKTRVITYRVAWLSRERGVDPGSIVAVTFTNKAAAEMRDRVERLVDLFPLPTFVGTFHRYALTLLRRWGDRVGLARDFAILDGDDQKRLMVQAMAAESISETSFPPRTILAAVSSAKNRLLTPSQYEATARDFFEQRVARAYRRYQSLLQQASGVDFDDMMALAVKLLAEDPEIHQRLRTRIRYLLVDEFQDTNLAQLRLVELLAGKDGNLTAVGDEDQGIYRWRGADLSNILEFERHFPSAVERKLEQNYRSTGTILAAANAVVSNNRLRRGKKLWTSAGRGSLISLHRAGDEAEEAAKVVETITALRGRKELSEMAILVRTNAQTRAFEDEFFRHRIPYVMVGGVRFYERAEIKDLVAYLRLLRNPGDTFSLNRILNVPPRGIGKTTVALLEERANAMGATPWEVLELDAVESFPGRAATALRSFRDLIRELRAAAAELPLPALLDELLAKTGYTQIYRREIEEEAAKLENIREFLSAAQTFTEQRSFSTASAAEPGIAAEPNESDADLLTAFLDHVALVSDLDSWEGERGVTLMTLHSAKGLEFPIVFLPGLEDGLIPHFNAQGKSEDLEEERRLFYVGLTRAEERLFLSSCRRRRIAGVYQDQRESPLLEEIPADLVDITESPRIYATERTRGIDEFYGRGASGSRAPEVALLPAATSRGPRRGSRVRHPTLGQGVILDLEGDGDDAKFTVFFERAGKKKLIARYANLENI